MTYYKIISTILLLTFLSIVILAEEPQPLSIGQLFHYETSYGDQGFKGKNINRGKTVPLYKEYENARKVILPTPSFAGLSVEKAIQKRASVRSFSEKALNLEQLAQILLSTNGITQQRGGIARRAIPSGGALYALDVYIIADNVESLTDGLYHFQVSDTSLELIEEGDLSDAICNAANQQRAVGLSPLTVILTARFDRMTKKYADRGYRYVYIEAGAACENIYLQATSLGMGTVAVGAFNDDAANKLLGIDGLNEATLLIMPIGFPAKP